MDIISEIIAKRSQALTDADLAYLLGAIGRLQSAKAKREALQVMYRNLSLTPNQIQSIVDHGAIAQHRELLRFAQKYARHHSYRSTQEFMITNEKMSVRRALIIMLIVILVAVVAAAIVPQISELMP